jgi:hypothetical protein
MSAIASKEKIEPTLSCIIPDEWAELSGNLSLEEKESSPELIAGIYLPTPSPKIIFVGLDPSEEFSATWGAASSGKGLPSLETPTGDEIKLGQEWFWSEEWQAAEREAEADLAAGRLEVFENDEDFLASLV